MFGKNTEITPITQNIHVTQDITPRGLRDFPLIADVSSQVRNAYVNRAAGLMSSGYDKEGAYSRIFRIARNAGHDFRQAEQLAAYAVANAVA